METDALLHSLVQPDTDAVTSELAAGDQQLLSSNASGALSSGRPAADAANAPVLRLSAASVNSVLHSWQEFDLNAVRVEIDHETMLMCNNQDRSVNARKALGIAVKSAKKVDPSESSKALGSLVKQFQKEVDELTKRADYAEACFGSLYKKLYELPDPVDVLSSAVKQHGELNHAQAKLTELEQQVSDYDEEFKNLKNQEVTIRRLEDRARDLESQLEEAKAQSVTSQREKELIEEKNQLIEEANAREQQLALDLTHTRDRLNKTQLRHDEVQATLLNLTNNKEHAEAARESESTMLFEELERANASLLSLQNERDGLQEQIHSLQSLAATTQQPSINSEASAAALEFRQRVDELEQHLKSAEKALSDATSDSENRIAAERARCEAAEALAADFQAQMNSMIAPEEHEKLKRKMHVLQALQFNAVDVEAEGESVGENLELVLLSKNKQLESDVTKLRSELRHAHHEHAQMKEELEANRDLIKEKSQLVTELERSLELYSSTGPHSNVNLQLESEKSSSSDSMTPFNIVVGQRDRYRKRVQALEAEQAEVIGRSNQLTAKIETLQKDNLKLYEKLKFVETYQKQRRLEKQTDIETGDVGRKYERIYQDSTNPFTDFSRKQRQRRYQNLNAFEKITLNTAQFCLSSRRLRNLLFVYAFALHALVFITLVTHTVSSHCPTLNGDLTGRK